MTLLEVLTIVCVSLIALLSVFLISNEKSRSKGFAWLGVFFLLLGLNLVDGVLFLNGFYLKRPYLALWEDPMVLLYGPIILNFSRSITGRPLKNRTQIAIHLLPFFILELMVVFFHLAPRETQIEWLRNIITSNLPAGTVIMMFLIFAHVFGYLIYSRHMIQRHRQQLKNYYASGELKRAVSIVNMILLLFVLSLLLSLLQYFSTFRLYLAALPLLTAVATVFTFRLLLAALQAPLFKIPYEQEFNTKLPQEDEVELKKRIAHYLVQSRPYTDPNFSLKDLADYLGESSRKVSYVINKSMAENFYDLVNDYRIQAAKEIIQSSTDPKLTVLEVMFEVGYQSKSSFNTQFKKRTGLTPREFKNSSSVLPPL